MVILAVAVVVSVVVFFVNDAFDLETTNV